MMVKYNCEICNCKYSNFEEADKCEKKGFIGPTLNPGLLLSHKKVEDGFLIFYSELKPREHEKTYHIEEIISNDTLTYSLQELLLTTSKLKEWMRPYKISTQEELDRLNKLIKEKTIGTECIKADMDRLNIKELHNKCNLDDLL